MSIRKNRRAVFAELLLMANPTTLDAHDDGSALVVRFDTVAELRAWLRQAGLDSPDLLTRETKHLDDDRPWWSARAYPTWHGWEIFASATEYLDTAMLDVETADQLAAVTAAA